MAIDMQIRTARADEAEALTDLALRSKASWGYDAAFIAACRAELTMTPEKMAAWRVWVAEIDGRTAGMVALDLVGDRAEIEDLFVEPDAQGQGVGRALIETLLEVCRASGAGVVGLDADPNAEPIYRRLGFETVGRSPSGSIPGRFLPRMEMRF